MIAALPCWLLALSGDTRTEVGSLLPDLNLIEMCCEE